jgi:hypothetical protein
MYEDEDSDGKFPDESPVEVRVRRDSILPRLLPRSQWLVVEPLDAWIALEDSTAGASAGAGSRSTSRSVRRAGVPVEEVRDWPNVS